MVYPNEKTETQRIIEIIEANAPLEKDIIKKYIDEHDTSEAQKGDDYYYKRNKIVDNVIYKFTEDGRKEIDHDATNNKLASGWHKLLVDQKVGYLVGDPVTIGYKDEEGDISDLLELLGEDFSDTLTELVKKSSNKGVEWLHPFIDSDGEFDFMIVPMQEIIPIYNNKNKKELVAVIRYYKLDLDDNVTKVEFWDDQTVTYYEIIDSHIYLDSSEEINPAPHFYYGNQGYGWGRVPFIPFQNNEEELSDLTFYQDTIDVYDKIMSKSANTIEDIQEFFYELKGYEGTDMEQAVTNLKRYKGVAVSSEGGIDIKQGEMPMDSVGAYLDRLRETIYQEGQGVDTNTDKFGNSPSGIALKFLFSLLDMKANVLERKFTKSLKKFMWFVCEYAEISGIGNFEANKITFTFNKSMLMNDLEQIQMINQSPELSTRTKLENHPMVSDVEQELERLEEELQNSVDLDEDIEDNDGEDSE